MTLPVSFDSPSARTPNENGTSAIALPEMLHLTRRSNAILNPSEFRLRAFRNYVHASDGVSEWSAYGYRVRKGWHAQSLCGYRRSRT